MSSRGESSGGGQSSLNYLFGSEEQPKPPPPKTVSYPLPPYGIDIDNNHNPPTGQGQHLGNVLTVSFNISQFIYLCLNYSFHPYSFMIIIFLVPIV